MLQPEVITGLKLSMLLWGAVFKQNKSVDYAAKIPIIHSHTQNSVIFDATNAKQVIQAAQAHTLLAFFEFSKCSNIQGQESSKDGNPWNLAFNHIHQAAEIIHHVNLQDPHLDNDVPSFREALSTLFEQLCSLEYLISSQCHNTDLKFNSNDATQMSPLCVASKLLYEAAYMSHTTSVIEGISPSPTCSE
jgi:hypothetical protein